MIFNSPLGMTRNNQNLIDSTFQDFFHNILNRRLVHNGQHFFRHSLSRREKPGSEPCRRDNRFSYLLHNLLLMSLIFIIFYLPYVNHPMEKSKVQLPHQRAAALYSLSNQNAGSSLIFLFLSMVMAFSALIA